MSEIKYAVANVQVKSAFFEVVVKIKLHFNVVIYSVSRFNECELKQYQHLIRDILSKREISSFPCSQREILVERFELPEVEASILDANIRLFSLDGKVYDVDLM